MKIKLRYSTYDPWTVKIWNDMVLTASVYKNNKQFSQFDVYDLGNNSDDLFPIASMTEERFAPQWISFRKISSEVVSQGVSLVGFQFNQISWVSTVPKQSIFLKLKVRTYQ